MSDVYLEIKTSDLPEVDLIGDHGFRAGDWSWDIRDGAVTRDDLLAVAAAVRWFEQHPEVVPDGD